MNTKGQVYQEEKRILPSSINYIAWATVIYKERDVSDKREGRESRHNTVVHH